MSQLKRARLSTSPSMPVAPNASAAAAAQAATVAPAAATAPTAAGWLARPQARLGAGGLVVLLTLANVIVPCSLDMYTPAVPSLPAYFGTAAAMVNLTIVGFYLAFSIGILVFGPLCDKWGRKPVLLGGLLAFTVGSALCALAWSIGALIAFRVVQALGAGAVVAVSTALVKDCFTEVRRGQMLAMLQVAAVLGPVLAPLLGGFILRFGEWHLTFVVLAVFGAVCLVFGLMYEESLPVEERSAEGVLRSIARLGVVAKNARLVVLLGIASLFSVPFMAYIACASYVYVDFYGLSEQAYSYFFAATAAVTVLGPLAYLRFSGLVSRRALTWGLIGVSLAAGVLVLTAGHTSAFLFCGCFALFAVAEATVRPYTTDIMLSLQEGDTGSASSLINCSVNAFGVLGMALMSLSWPDYVTGLGVVTIVSMVVALALWTALFVVPSLRIRQFEKR